LDNRTYANDSAKKILPGRSKHIRRRKNAGDGNHGQINCATHGASGPSRQHFCRLPRGNSARRRRYFRSAGHYYPIEHVACVIERHYAAIERVYSVIEGN
jgi:hypothetical protein